MKQLLVIIVCILEVSSTDIYVMVQSSLDYDSESVIWFSLIYPRYTSTAILRV